MIRQVHSTPPDQQPGQASSENNAEVKGERRDESEQKASKPETRLVRLKSPVQPVTGLRRVIYIFLATFFFILGIIGAILPVIPTTPFLLLTSFFLIRVSPHLNETLINAPLVGPILYDWQEQRGVRLTVKIQAIVIVLCAVASSMYFANMSYVGNSILVVLALIGIGVILRIPSLANKDNS
ncbi:Inner membrane protein YbaN [Polystyrenella longa]|uniref:Inner membrane protein YbaN n=1 Tax=Polystyrenella longa TaxID=2528007 RepID=A0A518CL13_9PLAN|nr:YbaN family protein [Polystyrenella longa]QDU79909.1 Inner membrane protein YbaN [Polystyrenella longa]